MFVPNEKLPGKFSQIDSTLDFYLRIKTFLNKKSVVLDLGAGIGDWYNNDKKNPVLKKIMCLKNDVSKYIAADIDKAVLKNKTSHNNILIKNNRIPLKNNSIDLIICDWVYEHIHDVKKFKSEIDRVLKKGGHVCARTPSRYSYIAFFSDILENTKLKSKILYLSQPSRKKFFKSYYNLNTKNKIYKIFKNYNNNIFFDKSEPAYFFGKKFIYYTLYIMHSLLPRIFTSNLIIFSKKKN